MAFSYLVNVVIIKSMTHTVTNRIVTNHDFFLNFCFPKRREKAPMLGESLAAGTTDESDRNTVPRNISLDARDAVLHDAPSAYCCPIGFDVMRDPVVLSAVLILIFPNSPWSPVRHPFGSACDALA